MEVPSTIVHAQAACIVYGKSINDRNELDCQKQLDDLAEVDIRYLVDRHCNNENRKIYASLRYKPSNNIDFLHILTHQRRLFLQIKMYLIEILL